MKNRITVLLCVCVVMLSLVGCGAKSSDVTGQTITQTYSQVSSFVYNNSLYFICVGDGSSELKKLDLPEKFTPDMAGAHLDFLQKDKNGISVSERETDMELCLYAPNPSDDVFVLKTSDGCYPVVKKDTLEKLR